MKQLFNLCLSILILSTIVLAGQRSFLQSEMLSQDDSTNVSDSTSAMTDSSSYADSIRSDNYRRRIMIADRRSEQESFKIDTVVSYYESGAVESVIPFYNNMRDGEAKFYYESGGLKEVRNYSTGRVTGAVTLYNENGGVKEFYTVEQGKRNGPTDFFDDNGQYLETVMFKDGKIHVETPYPVDDENAPPKRDEEVLSYKEESNTNDPFGGVDVTKPTDTVNEPEEFDPAYFVTVDTEAELKGGMEAIQKKLFYPELAKKKKIEGVVKVLAFVDFSGYVTETKVLEGIGYGCDEIAEIAVYYASFKPATINGRPVNSQVIVPVDFTLP